VQNLMLVNDLFVNINLVFVFLCFPLVIFFVGAKKFKSSTLLTLIIALLFFYQSATSILINIDRSRSFYVLSWVDKYQIKSDVDTNPYESVQSPEKYSIGSIQKRVVEQVNRGLISNNGSEFSLTRSGKVTLQVSNFFARIFNLQGWYQNKD
jgi:hypothetical protein